MLRDRSAEAEPDEPADDDADVIAGGEDAPPARRRSFPLLDRLRADPRSVPLAATALGLAAVFGSLVIDWATIRIRQPGSSQFEPETYRVAASNVGIGSGYLVGILAILALTAVAIFGTPAVRHNARVAGLAIGAGVLLLLVAATFSLDGTLNRLFPVGTEVEVEARYESGITFAYAATAALGLALYLAGLVRATRFATPDDGERGERSDAEEPVREVTVLPAPPFTGPDWRQQYPR